MKINTEAKDFVPKKFTILNFYGTDTCFSWNGNEFVCFPYLKVKNSTAVLHILKAPGKIKDFREFNQRVYILCYPTGIYKLTDVYELAVLSKSGTEFGSSYYEVLTLSNGTLILKDKKEKTIKKLCNVNESSDVNVLSLNTDNTDKNFYKAFLPSESKSIENFCFFACDNKLFKICEQNLHIIYNCDYIIKKISSVKKHQKISAIILQTNVDFVILVHLVDKKLKYDKIHLTTSIRSLCAVYFSMENVLFSVYSNDAGVHYATKRFNEDSLQQVKIEEKQYQSFRFYQSKFVIFLNNSGELSQVNIEQFIRSDDEQVDNFIELKLNMLNGIEGTIEIMNNKIAELKELQKEMQVKEDILKRINLFSMKNYIKYCPQDWVTRILKQTVLVSNFKNVLPKNSIIVKMLKSREKTIFSMKTVKDDNTVVEMPIILTNLSANLYTTTDLITHRSTGGIWCLMKNYVKDPVPTEGSSIKSTKEKNKFIKYKLLVLKNMIKNNKVSVEKLSAIKKEVRTLL